jgi:hypothetical protein
MNKSAQLIGWKPALRWLLTGCMALYVSTAFSAETARIAIIGDHRGDNKAVDKTTYARYTDDGLNRPILIDIATALKNEKVDLVLDVGDLVTKYTSALVNTSSNALMASELADWGNTWKQYSGNLPIFPVRGNQEVSADPAVWKAWTKTMPGIGEIAWNGPAGEEGLTFSFTYKNCMFVGIDQYMPPANNDVHWITPAALTWLNDTLKAPNKPFKFVFGHAPAFEVWDVGAAPFTKSKDGLASPLTKYSYNYNGINFMAMRDLFWDLLGEAGAQYYCGHDHLYARCVAYDTQGDWVRQVIMGNGGAPVVAEFPAVYTQGPFAEGYATNFVTLPASPAYQLAVPRVLTECFPSAFTPDPAKPAVKNYGFGYLIVDVQGAKATARYMAEAKAGAGFQMVETWEMKAGNNQGNK